MITVQEFRATQGKAAPRFYMSPEGVLTVRLTPVGKPRMTQRDKWDKRPCVMRYRDFADRLRAACGKAGFELGNELYAIFYLPMPKSWSKKKKAEKLGTLHDQKPDWDNMAKAVQDILSKEDKRVHTGYVKKYWSESGQPGKVALYPSEALFLSANKM